MQVDVTIRARVAIFNGEFPRGNTILDGMLSYVNAMQWFVASLQRPCKEGNAFRALFQSAYSCPGPPVRRPSMTQC